MKKTLFVLICFLFLFTGCMHQSVYEPENPPDASKPMGEDGLYDILNGMSLSEKVSQMFLARCPDENQAELLEKYPLGGYLFFAKDFEGETPESFKKEVERYQSASKIPMFLAVDEEGGTVNRVSRFKSFKSEPFLSPQALYALGEMDAIAKDAREKSEFLLGLGLNLNLAPVCDVSTNPEDFIYPRAFGKDAKETALYVKTVTAEMARAKIGSALKHFPGYGNNQDTHVALAYDSRPYETFLESDFLPFEAGIEAGAGMVLVSHNIVKAMDDTIMASLSPKVHDELRNTLHFDGIILTDDLVMDAIGAHVGVREAAVLAVKAGNDMLLSTDFLVQIDAVIEAVLNGEISEEQIDDSVFRILRYKKSLGLIGE